MFSRRSAYLVAELWAGVLQNQFLFYDPRLAAEYISRIGGSYGDEFPKFVGMSPHQYFDLIVRWVVERSGPGYGCDSYDGFEFIVTRVSLNEIGPVGAAAELDWPLPKGKRLPPPQQRGI